MVYYDNPDLYTNEEQQQYSRCSRWTNRLVWCTIVGCHVYMIVKGINPYGIL